MSQGFIKIKVYDSRDTPMIQNNMYQSMMTQNTDHLETSDRLQIVEELCQSVKGKVKSLSKKYEGAQSVVIIPASSGFEKKLNALLVYDSPFTILVWEHFLKEIDDFTIERAVNGKEALDIFMSKPEGYFDFIMMDLCMPVMFGQEAMRRIREMEKNRRSQVKLIAMSAGFAQYEVDDCMDQSRDIKADYFLRKLPFKQELEEIIEKTFKEKFGNL